MTTGEKLVDDLLELVAPLEHEALSFVVDAVKEIVTHRAGVEAAALEAKRAVEALAADAFIAS